MSLPIVLASLCFLMFVAYRSYSVILFAPIAALGAVLLTDPNLVAPIFTGLFMDKMVGFVKLYFPVFLLGAVIAALPAFLVVANALTAIPNPLVNEAITVSSLAGITGSASGGMSIALAVTGLTHRVSYEDIFAITLIKTIAVLVVIAIFYLTGIV